MKINDLVTRKSHGNDIIFRVIEIKENIAILKGEMIRIICDAPLEDLQEYDNKKRVSVKLPCLNNTRSTQLLKGKILHLDGDSYYLKKAMQAYRSYDLKAVGYYIEEKEMANVVKDLIKEHQPDILVLTGHDSLKTNVKDDLYNLTSYRNSSNFVIAVNEARSLISDKDSLVIIAGACQSYYEAIIEAGANFASSPERKNIHLLDPVIIAAEVALTRVNEYVEIDQVLNDTISKEMGGIDTRGRARKIFSGGIARDYG